MSEATEEKAYPNLNPNLEIKDSLIEGKGVFTKVPIEKGQKVVINIDPQPVEIFEFNDEEMEKFVADCKARGLQWDSISLGGGMHRASVAQRDKNPENYGNHSCDPNLSSEHIALRDIKTGEELTNDYAEISGIGWEMECHCGAVNCKGLVKGKVK